jgi:hypothetical protein
MLSLDIPLHQQQFSGDGAYPETHFLVKVMELEPWFVQFNIFTP